MVQVAGGTPEPGQGLRSRPLGIFWPNWGTQSSPLPPAPSRTHPSQTTAL